MLCELCADFVFFGIVIHGFNDPSKVLSNARKMLKATWKLINLDWKKEPMEMGPPLRICFSEDEAIRRIKLAGFMIRTVENLGPYHYLIVAVLWLSAISNCA
ncbi:hypothetical protein MUP77_22780 [Candidatus Bathyarchaeota archaeon]|nr:hypothetical protein [Candidatus Bathyarchaeota archaeon]